MRRRSCAKNRDLAASRRGVSFEAGALGHWGCGRALIEDHQPTRVDPHTLQVGVELLEAFI